MNFLFPSFLLAAAAVALPIIIHLFNFRRYKKVYFPSIQFLKEVKQQTTNRNTIKHLLVLFCRAMAILLAVLAFAQPFLKNALTNIKQGEQQVSIYIDNSFSMANTKNGVPMIELAKQKAIEIINGYNATTQFQIISNEMNGSQQHLVAKYDALKMVDEIKIQPQSPTLNTIIAKQKNALHINKTEHSLAYLISDFQKTQSNLSAFTTDTSFKIIALPLFSDEKQNISIDSCWFQSPVQTINQQMKLLVKISNYGNTAISSNRLTLMLNDKLKFVGDFSLAAHESMIDTIPFTITQASWNKGLVSINDNAVTFDDTYYFTFEVKNNINVLCINDNTENIYLKALFADKQINSTNVSAAQIDYGMFKTEHCIVLNSLKTLSSGLNSELQKFVQNGGSLIIIPNEISDFNTYNNLLNALQCGIYSDLSNKEQTVVSVNTQMDLMKDVFLKLSENMDLPKVKKHFIIATTVANNEEQILTLKDGSSLFSRFKSGRGNCYISAVPFDKNFSDLPIKAVFVPMLLKMAFSGIQTNNLAYVIGNNSSIQVNADISQKEPTFTLKSSFQEFIPEQVSIENTLYLKIKNQISKSGIFELNGIENIAKPAFAFNFNRNESDLNFYKEAELKQKLSETNISMIDATHKNMTALVSEINTGTVLWKWCLLFALLFLIIEIVLLRFWKV
ncbi:MAG: hypothetical protein RL708_925 [Bacteroidota bacterium]